MEDVKLIVDGYEHYFNFMYAAKITSTYCDNDMEIEWIDLNRGTILMVFFLNQKKIEMHSIRHRLIDELMNSKLIEVFGHDVEVNIETNEKLHVFFETLEKINYFST